jgi:hypothetical protein
MLPSRLSRLYGLTMLQNCWHKLTVGTLIQQTSWMQPEIQLPKLDLKVYSYGKQWLSCSQLLEEVQLGGGLQCPGKT